MVSGVRVDISSPLRSYTAGAKHVEASGTTVGAILDDLNQQFPGIRFRIVDEQGVIRQHMKIFVDADLTRDLTTLVSESNVVTLMHALSGG